ncbi:MAG TPA: hypothetical protein VGJ09_14435 [Bryobacteraceae bacterium]|jgi:mono/diheme cytochrome c family protein
MLKTIRSLTVAVRKASAALAFAGCAVAAPTFNQDIAPILYQNCATCHRPGEVAPFSLLTYQDAAKRAKLLADVVRSRFMPPWKPEPGHGDFLNTRRLTDQQIALMKEWAQAGAPEGDPSLKPEPPKFAEGWQVGKPDLVLTPAVKHKLSADGPDQFRCFVVPTGLDHDVYISGAEFRPGNRRVVHHALVFLDSTGKARQLAVASPDGSYPCFGGPGVSSPTLVGGWAPGATPPQPEPELSQPLKKGTDVVIQIHYHPSGKPEEDQSSLGLVFSGPPTKGRATVLVLQTHIDIPPGESHYVVKGSLVMPRDGQLAGIAPHAHYLGKEMKIDAHLPDGTEKPLIWIKDWDFNWQGSYRYRTPVDLPKGTRIDLEFSFDNSGKNPRNPAHPPVRVRWGEETKDEMALAFLVVVLPSPVDLPEFMSQVRAQYTEQFFGNLRTLDDLPKNIFSADQVQMLTRAFKAMDRNGDGVLDDSERETLLRLIRGGPRQ